MGRQKNMRKRLIKIIFAVLISIGMIAGAFAVYIAITVKPYPIDLDNVRLELTGAAVLSPEASTQAIADLSSNKKRIWVDISDVPKNLTNAIVSTEDKSFYTNNGVDYVRTLQAAVNFVLPYNKSIGGGSTITQQVIKNVEGNINDRTYKIKLKEIVTALNISHRYSKDQIMEIYVNIVTLGDDCYGVQTAAKLYFGKDINDLDLAQCATLASILPSPNLLYNPYRNPENVHERCDLILGNMLDQGMITKAQYTEAIKETVIYMH